MAVVVGNMVVIGGFSTAESAEGIAIGYHGEISVMERHTDPVRRVVFTGRHEGVFDDPFDAFHNAERAGIHKARELQGDPDLKVLPYPIDQDY